MATDLTYSIGRELLSGAIGDKKFAIPARSGGGRGATVASVRQASLSSYSPFRKMDKGVRGGAIPPGTWKILPPVVSGDSKGPWVSVLVPDDSTRQSYPQRDYDAARFKIHGPGPQGSDGCLVIEKVHRIQLLKAVKQAGGATLTVLWDGERLNERFNTSAANIA